MFIAFEGPDNVGKSHSAATLAGDQVAVYNVTRDLHKGFQHLEAEAPELPITYDRIDWFTHMVYRLAYPTRDWADDRLRTVFAMPDTHLVLKMHHPVMVDLIEDLDDGLPAGTLSAVNEMYWYQVEFYTDLNRRLEYSLFKSVSIIEVINNPQDGSFSQRMTAHDNPSWSRAHDALLPRMVTSDGDLLKFLREQDVLIG